MPAKRSTPYVILGLLRIAPVGLRFGGLSSAAATSGASAARSIPPFTVPGEDKGRPRAGGRVEGRRGRHTYRITAKGRATLDRWLREPPRPSPARDELLLKRFLSDREFLDPPEAWIRQLLAEETEGLRKLRRFQDQLPRGEHRHPNLRFWLFSLEHVERQAEATVAWCQKTLATITLLQQAQTRRRAAAHRRLLFE